MGKVIIDCCFSEDKFECVTCPYIGSCTPYEERPTAWTEMSYTRTDGESASTPRAAKRVKPRRLSEKEKFKRIAKAVSYGIYDS